MLVLERRSDEWKEARIECLEFMDRKLDDCNNDRIMCSEFRKEK